MFLLNAATVHNKNELFAFKRSLQDIDGKFIEINKKFLASVWHKISDFHYKHFTKTRLLHFDMAK